MTRILVTTASHGSIDRDAARETAHADDVTASDPDHDVLRYSLDAAPRGLSIHQAAGTVRWAPTADQIGPHDVAVRVRDPYGLSALQSFTIVVRGTNSPPRFDSVPGTAAGPGAAYASAAHAADPDGDAIAYRLAPEAQPLRDLGLRLDPATGLLTWAEVPAGTYRIALDADDSNGAIARQTYTLVVAAAFHNQPPPITSTPGFVATVGQPYQYQVTAADPDGEPLRFELAENPDPARLTIDATSGLLEWTPAADGPATVVVRAVDAAGAAASQRFTIVARTNHRPRIGPDRADSVTAGRTYRVDVPATDEDGDPLAYALDGAPAGMTIDALGRITWATARSQIAGSPYTFQVLARDDRDAAADPQTITLTIQADTTAPTLDIRLGSAEVDPGGAVTILVLAADDGDITALNLNVNGRDVILDARGAATVPAGSTPGVVSIVATARDTAGNEGRTTTSFRVRNPNAQAPTVAIHTPVDDPATPADETVITAPTDVEISVGDPDGNLTSYVLEAVALDGGPATRIAGVDSGAVPLDHQIVGTFDPTILANGSYLIRLSATDADGLTATTEQLVSVAGNLKLGNFRVAFTDLVIPVSGIPITVTRTYDSLDAHRDGEVGFGWRLDFGDMKVDVSQADSSLGAFGDEVPFRDGTRVTLTGPDGQPQGFTFRGVPSGGAFGFVTGYRPAFIPDPGITSRLSVPAVELLKVEDEYISLAHGGIPFNPADPAFGGAYDLTTLDGVTHGIDARTGRLRTLSDRNRNTLTFTDTGIRSDTGREVRFERDSWGRITALIDPRGNRVRYEYDGRGDLVAVFDRMSGYRYDDNGDLVAVPNDQQAPIRFVYSTTRPHYLAQILDPLGRTGVRTEYDDSGLDAGRVKRLTDAAGEGISNAYDPATLTQTITDPDGRPTTLTFGTTGGVRRVEDAAGGVTLRRYEGRNLMAETVVLGREDGPDASPDDPQDLTTRYTSDRNGLVLTRTDPLGNTTRYTYDAFGQPATATDPTGVTTRSQYDPRTGDLLSTTDAAGGTTAYEYDDRGLVTSVTTGILGSRYAFDDPGARDGLSVTRFGYNAFGELERVTDPRGVERTSTYDANGNRTGSRWTWVDPEDPDHRQEVVNRTDFDAADQPYRTVTPAGTTRTRYDSLGRPWRTTDPLGGVAETTYDARGNVIRTTRPDGTVSHTVADAQGRPIVTDDPHRPGQPADGTRTYYDGLGRVRRSVRVRDVRIEIVEQDGELTSVLRSPALDPPPEAILSETTTAYDDAGRTSRTVDAAGHAVAYRYDEAGRQTAVVDTIAGVTRRVETAYDAAGRPVRTRDALGHETHVVYDAAGRATRTAFPDGTSTTTAYDARGQRIAETDQAGNTTGFEYDAQGNLVAVVPPAVVDPEAGDALVRPRTEYTYDRYGNLALIRDAKGRETTFTYDALGRRLSRTLPRVAGEPTAVERWTYDAPGRMATHTDFAGQVARYDYDPNDPLGRLTAKSFFATTAATTPTATVTYAYDLYDAAGLRHETVTDSRHGATDRAYDRQGRLVQVTSPEGVVRYAYDPVTGQKLHTWTERTDLRYGYDEVGRLETVTAVELNDVLLATPLVTTYGYDAADNLVATRRPNGTAEDRRYDELNRLVAVEDAGPGGVVLSRFTYTLDPAGHRTAVDELDGRRVEYTYDDLYRLTRETIRKPGSGPRTIDYAYDRVGNRLSRRDSAGDFVAGFTSSTYDARDRLIDEEGSASRVTSTYDANGSTETRTDGVTDAVYSWDEEGRLVAAVLTERATGAARHLGYRYNAEGIRVASIDDGRETRSLIDGEQAFDQVLEEYAPGGALAASYVRGLDLIFQDRRGDQSYFLKDGLGSTRALTDAMGAITDTFAYNAYGQTISHTGNTPNEYQFAGEARDPDEQYYLRARYYDAAAGRFTSPDTNEGRLDEPATLNHYAYAAANPVDNVDPSGHEFSLAGLGVTISTNIGLGIGLGGAIGAIDAAFGGQDIAQGFLYGALLGGIFGGIGTFLPPPVLAGITSFFTGLGVGDSLVNQRYAQAFFRTAVGLFALRSIFPSKVQTSITPAGTTVTSEPGNPAIAEELVPVLEGSIPSAGGGRGGIGPVNKGALGERLSAAKAWATGERVLGTQVSFEVEGVRIKVDVVTEKPDGTIVLVEAKNGANAPLSPNQATAYPQAPNKGVTPVGQNAAGAGLIPGVRITRVEVRIDRWDVDPP